IRFSVPETAQVTLVVYDVLGRQVRVLVDGVRETGIHEAVFEAGNLPSGVYLSRLTAGSISQTKRMTLLK
ncbi:T9SS type A sorting domain-containing protein, partial [Shewanella sp. C31]|nr:T9SS type A sorting domain-containing protein [Shewanella electrica]